jgi:hypothetical protein
MLNSSHLASSENPWTLDRLSDFCRAWMRDINDYCTVDYHASYINSRKASFNLNVRNFRLKNPWLINNFEESDTLSYLEPVNGSVIYYGYRKNINDGREIVVVLNMEGQPKQVIPTELGLPVTEPEKWNVALSTPNITRKKINEPVRLAVSQGLLFEKS